MLSIQYKLDDEILIDDTKYRVNASFDVIIRLIDLLNDKTVSPQLRIDTALLMLIGDKLDGYDITEQREILQHILDHYVKTYDEVEYDLDGNPMPVQREEKQKLYDLNHDAEYIYAAFMQVYGIDLIEQQGKLHWLKFKALLSALPHNTMFSKIIEIRNWSPEKDKEKRNTVMRRLQKQYALPGIAHSEEVE